MDLHRPSRAAAAASAPAAAAAASMDLPPHLDRLPAGCLLHRRVRTDFEDGDELDLIAQQPFKILRCVDRKASGFSPVMQPYADEVVQTLHIGVHLAEDADYSPGSPSSLSCLVLKGGSPLTAIEAVDEGVIVLTTTFLHDFSRIIYVVYDAVRGSLHMAPAPEDPSWMFTSLTVRLLIARPSIGDDDYALLLLGKLDQQGDALLVWRPSSSSTVRPWSEVKLVSIPPGIYEANVTFSAKGMGCWVDLLRGGIYCHLDTLFNNSRDKQPLLDFHLFPLPKELANKMSEDCCRKNIWAAQPKAYRTVGAVHNAAVLFVSIDGFLEHVKNTSRTVSVWWLNKQDMEWYLKTKVNLRALRPLHRFCSVPTGLAPMFPLLNPTYNGAVYFAVGKIRTNDSNQMCIPTGAQYLLELTIRDKVTRSIISLAECFDEPVFPDFVPSNFCQYARVVDLDSHILMIEMKKQQSSKEQDGRPHLPAHYYYQSRLAQSAILDTDPEHHSGVIME